MSVLLKIYDDVTSNKYMSLGITVSCTVLMACRSASFMSNTTPLVFLISACAGAVFALLANYYLAHNKSVKSECERNNIYATFSLIMALSPINIRDFNFILFTRNITPIFKSIVGCNFCVNGFINGFGMGFLATNLVLQLMEKSNENQV